VRAIVLIKQVPDLRGAPIGMRPDGTIDRAGAPAITNPADLHALEAALNTADEVWALSMGPPNAEKALREAVALGATRAVLLCDRALAGSDTWATANALAAAIESLGACDLVMCGITALDGETGQVGPQVATRLGWPQATGCEALALEGASVVVRRIVEGGFERLRLPLPAVVSIAETAFAPRYPSLMGRRRAKAAVVERLDAGDIGLDSSMVGLNASPTKVAHVEPAPLLERSCRFVGSDGFTYDGLVRALVEVGGLTVPGVRSTPTGESATAGGPTAEFAAEPSVWVVCELPDGRPARVSLELLSKATELAPALGGGVGAIVAGHDLGAAVDELTRHGVDTVFVADHEDLDPYRAEPHARVISQLAAAGSPSAVLFGATTTGRDLAPRVAAMLDTGLAADCTDLLVAPWERRGVHYEALLHQVRPAMAGGVLATCLCPEARPQMATVRPGTFELRPTPRKSRIQVVPVELAPADLRVEVVNRETSTTDVGIADADVIIAGGAGCDISSWHLVEELATAVGGRVAASRGAVEAGLAPRALQVGQTGTTVHPLLYIACGISGALQHAVGMRTARTVVAINRDPEAFIFRLAHFGIVADVRDALPQLTAAIHRSGA
jgi:electron transfer flavoprotein alpha subunit